MSEQQIIGPTSPFQEKYLTSDAQIILVGGAAGSSKSYVGLMRHLRWAEDPNYRAYCIRKNSSAIMASGGLFWEAVGLYRQYDPNLQVKLKDQKLVFSSGAEVSFSHYENDTAANKYQGIQISNIFYDEVTHADNEEQIWWLWSRLRSQAKNKHSIWMSCNPDNTSWVLKYAEWYLYPPTHELAGRPDPEKNGVVRYLLRIGGELYWGDTEEELIERYGNPDLPYDHEEQVKPISFMGLFGTIDDNPVLKKTNPLYKSNLEALPRLERERLLHGNWYAKPEGSSLIEREWFKEVDEEPPWTEIETTARAYDFAFTKKSDTNPSPDYTASVKISRLKCGDYFIHDVRRARLLPGEWLQFILDAARDDGNKVDIVLPIDPGAGSAFANSILVKQVISEGFFVRQIRAQGRKADRFRPFASMVMNGGVQILRNCGTDYENKIYNDLSFFYTELENFNGTRRKGEQFHDDG